jgi:dTDP-4-amino-4,6-dideoxygalactose transaminase
MFYLLLENNKTRDSPMNYLKNKGILAVFHYVLIHLSPMGSNMECGKGNFPITERVSDCVLRLPLFYNISENDQDTVIKEVFNFF